LLAFAIYTTVAGGLSFVVAIAGWHLFENRFLLLREIHAMTAGQQLSMAASTEMMAACSGRRYTPDRPCIYCARSAERIEAHEQYGL